MSRTRKEILETSVWSDSRDNWISMADQKELTPESLLLEVLLDIRDLLTTLQGK